MVRPSDADAPTTGTLPCVVKVQVTAFVFVMIESRSAPAATVIEAVVEYVRPEKLTVNVEPETEVEEIVQPVAVILVASASDAVPLIFVRLKVAVEVVMGTRVPDRED